MAKQITKSLSSMEINPSIWFDGDDEVNFFVVRVSQYPERVAAKSDVLKFQF